MGWFALSAPDGADPLAANQPEARRLAREEGVLAHPFAGAVLHASLELAARPQNAGKMIVAIMPLGT